MKFELSKCIFSYSIELTFSETTGFFWAIKLKLDTEGQNKYFNVNGNFSN